MRNNGTAVRIVASTLVALAFVTGCGSGQAKHAARVSTGGSSSAALDGIQNGGFATSPMPLSRRHNPLVVAAENDVVAYGGFTISGEQSEEQVALGDGAIYSVSDGKWNPIPSAPFESPLYQVSGVWTGQELLVLGTPCGTTTTEVESARCGPGGVAMAAYSPAKSKWRTITGVEAPNGANITDGAPLQATGLGWTGKEAVFAVTSQDPAQQLLLVDPSTETSRWGPGLEGSDVVCMSGGKILGVKTGEVGPGGVVTSSNAAATDGALLTFGLDDATLNWVQLDSTPKPDSKGAIFEETYCQGGQLVYVPVHAPPTGFDSGGLWWNTASRSWDALPSFGAIGYSGAASVAEVDGIRVMWLLGTDKLLVLKAGAPKWTVVKQPIDWTVDLSSLSNLILLTPPSDGVHAPDVPTLGFLDPGRYVDTQG